MTERRTGEAMVRRGRFGDGAALLALGLLLLLAFWHIGPAGRVIAGGDLFTYFYPYWAEAARAFRAGRLPLWNPYLFMGVPFLANSQAGVLYPLNWPFWLLLSPHLALHWSGLLHLWIAGCGAYLYARRALGLGHLGAWTAGAALALGGYLGAQIEHINQLQALAWLPWALLLWEVAISPRATGFPHRAFGGLALVVGLILLAGHTQSAFIALFGLGMVALIPRAGIPLRRRLAVFVGAAVLGGALAAAQLLPTAELARLSVRSGGLPFNERVSFSLSPLYLARAVLPTYGQSVPPENLEYVATLGVTGLLLALYAGIRISEFGIRSSEFGFRSSWFGVRNSGFGVRSSEFGVRGSESESRVPNSESRVPNPDSRVPFYLSLLGLFLALGLYNPLYLLLARFVPGFAHFRAPARWLALWALGAALLAGAGVDALGRAPRRLSARGWAVSGGLMALLFLWGALGGRANGLTIALWLGAAALAGALLALGRRFPRPAALGLTALLVVELLLSGRALPHARATAPESYTSLRPANAHLLAAGKGRLPPDRFLSISALAFDPGDRGELEVIYGPQLGPDALYQLLIAAKGREVLSPNLPLAFGVPAVDGYDGGLLPLARYVALGRAFLPAESVSIDGRLRENLRTIPDGRWLSLLNVRYIITDKVFDAWLDNVFYDLQFGADLVAGEEAAVAYIPPFEATAVGLVSYLDGAAALPDGTRVGEVTVVFADGSVRRFPLRAGVETAEGIHGPEVAHARAPVGGHFWPGRPEGNDYAVRLRWNRPAQPVSISVRATLPQGRLVVRGLSLIDERTGAFQSLVLSDRGRFRLVHSGDVKIYENLDVLPRAFVVHRARGSTALPADFDPTAEIIVEGGPEVDTVAEGPERVQVTVYETARVEVEVEMTAPGYLVLTDAHYPGWRAWVDGEEVPIATADLLFRAVYLEPGRHRVVFAFHPRTLWIGAAITLTALLLLSFTALRFTSLRFTLLRFTPYA